MSREASLVGWILISFGKVYNLIALIKIAPCYCLNASYSGNFPSQNRLVDH